MSEDKKNREVTRGQAALIAGFGLLGMFLAGIIASGPQAASSFEAIIASTWRLRLNIAGDFLMLTGDVVAALGLYVFFKNINKTFSLLSALFRMTHVAIYGVMIINLCFILYLLSGAESLAAFSMEQIHSLVKMFLNGHEYGFRIGLVFFGFHFLLIGILILKSTDIPKVLAILLLIVAAGYLINSFAGFLMPHYGDFKDIIQMVVFLPAIVAELSLCFWLIIKGRKLT